MKSQGLILVLLIGEVDRRDGRVQRTGLFALVRAEHVANAVVILQAFLFLRLHQHSLFSVAEQVQHRVRFLILQEVIATIFVRDLKVLGCLLFKHLLLETLEISFVKFILVI